MRSLLSVLVIVFLGGCEINQPHINVYEDGGQDADIELTEVSCIRTWGALDFVIPYTDTIIDFNNEALVVESNGALISFDITSHLPNGSRVNRTEVFVRPGFAESTELERMVVSLLVTVLEFNSVPPISGASVVSLQYADATTNYQLLSMDYTNPLVIMTTGTRYIINTFSSLNASSHPDQILGIRVFYDNIFGCN